MSFICIVCRDLLSNNPPVDDGPVQGAAAALPVPPNNDIVATKCGHLYHLSCLRDWFNKQANPRQECPYCKMNVKTDDYQRIYPIGDEESEDIETRLKNAKEVQKESIILKGEKAQGQLLLMATKKELEESRLNLEILQYEFQEQSEELNSLRSERTEQQQILETIEKSYKELINKLEKDKTKLEKMLEESEVKLIARQVEMEQRNHTAHNHSSDSANMIRDLTTSHEFLRNEIRALQEQLRTTNKVSPPKRTMGSQTDGLPIDEDDLSNPMSRLKVVDYCLKYFAEEKKQQEVKNTAAGGDVEGQSSQVPSSVPDGRHNAVASSISSIADTTQLSRPSLSTRPLNVNSNSGLFAPSTVGCCVRRTQPTEFPSVGNATTRPRPTARSQISGGHVLGRQTTMPAGQDELGILHPHDN